VISLNTGRGEESYTEMLKDSVRQNLIGDIRATTKENQEIIEE
jgi:hypothetical protein